MISGGIQAIGALVTFLGLAGSYLRAKYDQSIRAWLKSNTERIVRTLPRRPGQGGYPDTPVRDRHSYARDRGCSAPGCGVKGYYSEVHHVTDYAKCRTTDVNDLTFACGTNHRLLRPGGWSTRKSTQGETEWIPPRHLDRGQPRTNTFHHPEKLVRDGDDDDDAA